ncbi:adenosine deaminase family protein [Aquicella lusitana]|uniref:adenosine deaminase n=1 Tax=Aquicella lusitana TaxID=254246 RepID=A0A370GFX0_9COXI|nr:adenosine deaminase [Aquicella lusitana]RDI42571.1 adenosine deaminase [Aquicella lusitana]VVC74350.1 Aminodeoxyfutalosine deaminase [Aquicella lusitana]
MQIRPFFAFVFSIFFLLTSFPVAAQSSLESSVENYFESIQSSPHALSVFLRSMPKGGDLHNHASGATYAENLIRYAKNDDLCINRQTYAVFADAQCTASDRLDTVVTDPALYDAVIDAWSMRHFVAGKESGHDHFFATFGKFGVITGKHSGEMLAEISQRAAMQNELYVELMVTADNNESGKLGKRIGWDPDFSAMRDKLLAADFQNIIQSISKRLNDDEAQKSSLLACQSTHPKAGCGLKVRYLYQVLREQPPEMVFAQLLAGFEAASKDPRVVGINMVQPEDGVISMRDYALHMQMVQFLHNIYPNVRVSLHAGELNDQLVPPEGLKFHITDAVEVAGANRIGHGVDIAQETKAYSLLKEMADKGVMVEINLSSNEGILGIQGKEHPLPLYLRYGVPVALSTDDEGVSRSNLTTEYVKAVTTYHLSYPTLKNMVRNSIAYAFVPGENLWTDRDYRQPVSVCAKDSLGSDKPSSACRVFLDANEKASLQWELEKRFVAFERRFKN